MDLLFILGVAMAVLMISAGLFLIVRKPKAPAADAAAPLPEVPAGVQPPVVPRDQRPAYQVGESSTQPDMVQDMAADAVPLMPSPAPTPTAADFFDDVKISANRDIPVMDDVSEPTVRPAQEHRPVTSEAESLDSMLSELDEATAKLSPPVERAQVDDWDGETDLIDAHLDDQARRDESSVLAQAQQIIALYLLPPVGRTLSGERVLHLLRQYGLRFGEMSLFHRFEESDGRGELMFSVLKYTSEGPAGFDLETIEQEKIEGLAFFLALPSAKPVHGFDMMNSISNLLSRDLNSEVYDEQMNPLTKQLREHYRHQVLEFRPST